jgi:hypothetical protein
MKSTCPISRRAFAFSSSAMKRDSTSGAQPSLAYSFAASQPTTAYPTATLETLRRFSPDVHIRSAGSRAAISEK